MIGLIARILAVASDYRGRLRLAFAAAFLKAVFAKAPMIIAFFLITGFMAKAVTPAGCLWAGVALLACVAVQCGLQYAADRLQSAAGFMVFADMRMRLGAHLRRLPMGFFTEGAIGRISSVLSTDMEFIEQNCMMVLADLTSYLFAGFVLAVCMFFFDVRLGAACLLVTAIVFAIGEMMKKNTLMHSDERQRASQKLTEAVLEFTQGIGIIKTCNILGEKSKELAASFEESCRKSIAFELDYAPWARAVQLACGLGSVLLLGVSFRLFQTGEMSAAYFVGMMIFVYELFAPLKSFYGQVARLTVMNSCMDRIEAVFAEAELADEGRGAIPETADAPEIEFDDVRFAYGEREVLHGVSFKAERRTMTALVGPSGGGKSTIASLLPRLWDVQSGAIRLRGADIREVPLADLMAKISMVFQRVYLFRDTVFNNIALGRPEATREEVEAAAKKARCHDFIMALPDGYETVIGEGGATLSGGEAQRVSIARCILKDAPIVILDEATASIDADNERHIQEAIGELVRGKTLLVIAHRLHTIAAADQILVIEDGKIAESGKHEELMAKGGRYAEMVRKRASSAGFVG